MKKIKQIWNNRIFVILLLFIILVGTFCADCNGIYVLAENSIEEAEEKLGLYAQSAVLMDANSGRILYEKNAHTPMANASTTKILTCIVALESGNMEEIVTASDRAAAAPKVHLGMKAGNQYRLLDLLYALMLESFNDCAIAIAEHISGSVENFAKKMNEKAKEIGCEDTYFITPNGLDEANEGGEHHTTAADLALLMRYCITASEKTPQFLEITRTKEYSFSNRIVNQDGTIAPGKISYHCSNHNAFLSMMEGALSGKTGFTAKAGYCYVGALKQGEKTFIVALLACGWPNNKSYKWKDTVQLMNYGLENYEYQYFNDIRMKTEELPSVIVLNSQTDRIGEDAYTGLEIISENGKDLDKENKGVLLKKGETIEKKVQYSDRLEAPVHKGDPVGKICYYIENNEWVTQLIVTTDNIEKIDYRWCFLKVIRIFLI